MKTIYLGKRFSIFQLSLTHAAKVWTNRYFMFNVPKENKQISTNIRSQHMVPLMRVNRYSHKVFSRITCSKILFSSIKWQHIQLQWLQMISLSLTSNWRNWTVSKRQKANKKPAAAIFVEACPCLSMKPNDWQHWSNEDYGTRREIKRLMANWRPADVRLVQFEISWLVSSDFI